MNILHVEDSLSDHVMLRELFRLASSDTAFEGEEIRFTHVTSLRKAKDVYDSSNFDFVLLDVELPDSCGVESISEFLTGTRSAATVVVLTGHANFKAAYEAGLRGAMGYLSKDTSEDQKICGCKCALGIAERRKIDRDNFKSLALGALKEFKECLK